MQPIIRWNMRWLTGARPLDPMPVTGSSITAMIMIAPCASAGTGIQALSATSSASATPACSAWRSESPCQPAPVAAGVRLAGQRRRRVRGEARLTIRLAAMPASVSSTRVWTNSGRAMAGGSILSSTTIA